VGNEGNVGVSGNCASGAGDGGTIECSLPTTGLLHPGPGVDGAVGRV
jgi:hypothetical protein